MTDFSFVEQAFLAKSGRQNEYGGERIPIVEVQNVYELGKFFFFAIRLEERIVRLMQMLSLLKCAVHVMHAFKIL